MVRIVLCWCGVLVFFGGQGIEGRFWVWVWESVGVWVVLVGGIFGFFDAGSV